jgi:hypothetical protein
MLGLFDVGNQLKVVGLKSNKKQYIVRIEKYLESLM